MAIPITHYPPFGSLMPEAAFDSIIANGGQRVMWMKGHNCPCTGDTGSPLRINTDPIGPQNKQCPVCLGKGVYWDPAQGPFIVLLTLITWIGRNVDIGDTMDPNYGMIFDGHPIITIPATLPTLWTQTNTNDIFVQMDSTMRFQAVMRVGENESVPAWHVLNSISIANTGAVIVEDPTTSMPVSGIAYVVSGGTVTLSPNAQYPTGYPVGTSYTVEYYSPVAVVIQEPFGGLAHTRPFGQGISYPRRFKTSLLDLWLREQLGSSTSIT